MNVNKSGTPTPSLNHGENVYYIESNVFVAKSLVPALYIVSTPIGNLADITLRALQTLAAVDLIACEDTRVSQVLLRAFGISKALKPYHEHNAKVAGAELLNLLQSGKSVALISDAGTPLVSDPGSWLVKEALDCGIKVVPIPGASSVLAALVSSGLDTKEFLFIGFLPPKQQARIKKLQEIAKYEQPIVLFEAPHRLINSLEAIACELGEEQQICICRELTKIYEDIKTDTVKNLLNFYKQQERVRGELVIIIDKRITTKLERNIEEEQAYFKEQLKQDLPLTKIAAKLAQELGRPKQEIYKQLVQLNKLAQ